MPRCGTGSGSDLPHGPRLDRNSRMRWSIDDHQGSTPVCSAPRNEAKRRARTIERTAGAAASRVSLQPIALACGSRSRTAVFLPAISAATAGLIASVVLPAPPL